jgi:hypothetical protein
MSVAFAEIDFEKLAGQIEALDVESINSKIDALNVEAINEKLNALDVESLNAKIYALDIEGINETVGSLDAVQFEETLENLNQAVSTVEEMSEKLRQYQAKRRQLEIAKKKEDERKRVHRLIPIGAVFEKVLGRPIENEELPKLERFLRMQERNGNYFSNAMNQENGGYGNV